ncbi:hypothetical protein LshimejAT787_0601890 [Lyophyllum shimeji]|uniref:Uncharacterized protein n=1 Tax=Lyophyllum shimeji TaxID=47721 RepID=A0A9P3UN73_LYOSH|nr:hypothetical protein LshimejAT787_0601890 [Lyophyllum shimeji]
MLRMLAVDPVIIINGAVFISSLRPGTGKPATRVACNSRLQEPWAAVIHPQTAVVRRERERVSDERASDRFVACDGRTRDREQDLFPPLSVVFQIFGNVTSYLMRSISDSA